MFRAIAAAWFTGWVVAIASDIGKTGSCKPIDEFTVFVVTMFIIASMLLGATAWQEALEDK